MSSFRDALARGRQQLNPLATSLPVQQSYPTPQSAASSLSTPFGYHAAPYTPASAVRQYNPQQWGQSAVGPENAVRYAPGSDVTEAPAPPPYSPPRSNRPAGSSPEEAPSHGTSPAHVISPGHGMSPAHRMSPASIRPSPEPASAPVFPPPPGASRSRAMSRDRPTNIFNFGRRQTGHDTDLAAQRDTGRSLRPLQLNTEALYSPGETTALSPGGRPPAARRAASAGAIETPTYAQPRIYSGARWDNGMPIPPPPPCPPPRTQPRSQSMSRTPDSVMLSPPTRRPQPISSLGPVPPTPADWQEEDVAGARGRSPNRGLQIDTTSAVTAPPPAEVNSGATSGGSSGLSRTPAVRGESRSIRERRSESRTAHRIAMEEPLIVPMNGGESVLPSDITVPPVTTLTRRATINRSTPRSGRGLQGMEAPGSAKSVGHATPTLALNDGSESRDLTPRTASSSRNKLESPTPPFSPNHGATFSKDAHHVPRSLPTPPPQSRRPGSPRPLTTPTPMDSNATTPVSPRKRTSAQANAQNLSSDFVNGAIHRHNEFARKEAAAVDDEERVRLFADFVVSESRLRRERYATAIDAMGSEILELTRDIFRPYSKAERSSLRRASDRGDNLPTIQTDSAQNSRPGSSASSAMTASPPVPQGESAYYNNGYKPSLSPIASMAASDNPDESSSRGRPPSRWWESTSEPSVAGLGLSKRESKYMGVPKEARESLQWEDSGPASANAPTTAGSSSQTARGSEEYPPEKTGWHEDTTLGENGKTPTSAAFRQFSPVPPATPNPKHLDVSRLVTLPPPYPRHHPAVNNSHPDLTSIRDAVRALSDFSLAQATKEQFDVKSDELKKEVAEAASQRKQALRARIIREIEAGTMTYADAAQAEAESVVTEAGHSKAQSKAAFERFQTAVVGPLNDLFMDRIHQSTTLFEQLRGQLFVDAQQQSPNMPQEQGDEQPELLEKLTLLKWLFEAREGLHRQIYDLLTDRNDQYRDMVIEPYRLAGNDAKVANAVAFFAADGRKRVLEYEGQSLTRTVEFMDVVETNVIRGVEDQLGAFWDIAPNLRQIIEKVPTKLTREFSIVIPREEYEDNPEYAQFPLQYLYHLLEHGEKSTYQFIEAQINLLCLLHEVKSAVASVRGRVDQAEAASRGRDGPADIDAIKVAMEAEEQQLTEDLKEKVRCVEGLWNSGIGVEFGSVKQRVKDYLIGIGGWEGVENAV